MELKYIISKRRLINYASYDLVVEWEDVMASALGIPIVYDSKWRNRRPIRDFSLGGVFLPSQSSFMFELFANRDVSCNQKNIIPCIVDFYTKDAAALSELYKRYSKAPVVLVSSQEAVDFLKSVNCPLNIKHLALSISDVYKISPSSKFDKQYDLVLMGRQNPILKEYLNRYVNGHKDFVYVYRKQENGAFNCYTSEGQFLGNIDTREDYINLMRKARIGFYATPGIDGGENRTRGFNQVTPRFLEYMACGCHIIARYPKNSDTDYYELSEIAPNIETYEQFESAMDKARQTEVDMKKYSDYLSMHYTSVRARELQNILQSL